MSTQVTSTLLRLQQSWATEVCLGPRAEAPEAERVDLIEFPQQHKVIHRRTSYLHPKPFPHSPFCSHPLADCGIHSSVAFCHTGLKTDGSFTVFILEQHSQTLSNSQAYPRKCRRPYWQCLSVFSLLCAATGVYSVSNTWLTRTGWARPGQWYLMLKSNYRPEEQQFT